MNPVVHVLLATYNGERHLPEQWASLEAQQGVDLVVHAGDDGSTDGTVQVLRRLAAQRGGAIAEVRWLDAPPRRSATKSFVMLLQSALAEPAAQWFAFCDQDDIWLPEKLSAALVILGGVPPDRPALYGGRTLSVDEEDRPGELSPLFTRPACFRNAVVQSIMGGNTMLMNRGAAMLLAGSSNTPFTAHDWFSYQLVTAVGGFVHYDPTPYVRYRQHAANVVGSNQGWGARWRRLKRLLNGDFRQWNDLHVTALLARQDRMLPDSRRVITAFDRARRSRNPVARLVWLWRSGVFRQTPLQQFTLWLGCLLHRI